MKLLDTLTETLRDTLPQDIPYPEQTLSLVLFDIKLDEEAFREAHDHLAESQRKIGDAMGYEISLLSVTRNKITGDWFYSGGFSFDRSLN